MKHKLLIMGVVSALAAQQAIEASDQPNRTVVVKEAPPEPSFDFPLTISSLDQPFFDNRAGRRAAKKGKR